MKINIKMDELTSYVLLVAVIAMFALSVIICITYYNTSVDTKAIEQGLEQRAEPGKASLLWVKPENDLK